MLSVFNFSQTTPAGAGLNLEEGYYACIIKGIDDKEGEKGKSAVITLTIDPSEGVTGTVKKTMRYPNGDPNDGVLTFWMAMFMSALKKTEEELKNKPLKGDPKQFLVGKPAHIYFKPDARTYTDEATGKEKTAYDVRLISPTAFKEGKAGAKGAAGKGAAAAKGGDGLEAVDDAEPITAGGDNGNADVADLVSEFGS